MYLLLVTHIRQDRTSFPRLGCQTLRYRQSLCVFTSYRWKMSILHVRNILFLAGSSVLTVGCATKNPDPQQQMAPPGWNAAPPPGAMVAPAPSGCSSCGASNPVVNAPRYAPPMPASPPLTSVTPGLSMGTPVSTAQAMGPIQAAFTPTALPIETARFGVVQVEESTSIPVPPTDKTEEQKTGNVTKS